MTTGRLPAESDGPVAVADPRPDSFRASIGSPGNSPPTGAGPLGRGRSAPERLPGVRSQVEVYLRLCRGADMVAAPVLLLSIFLASNLPVATSLEQFLAMRVTVRNLAYVVGFA